MAYNFNGTSQRLTIGSSPVSGIPITLAAWVRPTAATGVDIAVSVYASNDSDRVSIFLNSLVSNVETTNDGVSGAVSSGGTATQNTWGHLAGVVSLTNSRLAYWNGTAGTTNTTNITGLSTFNRISVGTTFEGANNVTVSGLFAGDIAEVGVWNVVLTQPEIASLADGFTCDKVRPSALVFYAPLVRSLQDVRGGLTITNNNTATVAAHTRVYA